MVAQRTPCAVLRFVFSELANLLCICGGIVPFGDGVSASEKKKCFCQGPVTLSSIFYKKKRTVKVYIDVFLSSMLRCFFSHFPTASEFLKLYWLFLFVSPRSMNFSQYVLFNTTELLWI